MKLRSIEDLVKMKMLAKKLDNENTAAYGKDFASGILDDLKMKYVAYYGGKLMKNKDNEIIHGNDTTELLRQFPNDDKVYLIEHVGVIDVIPGGPHIRN